MLHRSRTVAVAGALSRCGAVRSQIDLTRATNLRTSSSTDMRKKTSACSSRMCMRAYVLTYSRTFSWTARNNRLVFPDKYRQVPRRRGKKKKNNKKEYYVIRKGLYGMHSCTDGRATPSCLRFFLELVCRPGWHIILFSLCWQRQSILLRIEGEH